MEDQLKGLTVEEVRDEREGATAADSTEPSKGEEKTKQEEEHILGRPDEISDVVLEVEGRELQASRAVLAHYSPVFCRMFYSEFAEKSAAKVPLVGKNFKSMVNFFNVLYPATASAKSLVSDANLIELLALADEYQTDQVKVVCQHYVGEQLAHYFHNFYDQHAKDPLNNPSAQKTPLLRGNMEGQNLTKKALIEKLVLYLWACDQYQLPAHREDVKSLLISLVDTLKEVTTSRHYPALPPLSKVDLLEGLCGKFERSPPPPSPSEKPITAHQLPRPSPGGSVFGTPTGGLVYR